MIFKMLLIAVETAINKVKAMYPNKPTRPYVDELFANWQD